MWTHYGRIACPCTATSAPTTPELEAWAGGGTVFEHAIAASSWTVPSMSALWTGQYRHGPGQAIAPNQTPLAELLRERGFTTHGIVANPILGDLNGFTRGWDGYELQSPPDPETGKRPFWPADEVVTRGLSWLDERPAGRFFLYLHLFDPHEPYQPVDGVRYDWNAELGEAQLAAVANTLPPELRPALDPERHAELERTRAAYDSEVWQADRALGRLFRELTARGLSDETLIVFVSDHGEGLGTRPHEAGWTTGEDRPGSVFEHLVLGHGLQLHAEQVHVPLVLRGPGVPAGVRRTEPVSLVDVVPTVLHALDVAGTDGLSGTSLLDPPPSAPGDVYAWSSRGASVLEGGRYRLHEPSPRTAKLGGSPRVYDLQADPGERRALADAALEARLRDKLNAWTESHRNTEALQSVDEMRRILSSLGYADIAESLDEDSDVAEVRRELLERRAANAEASSTPGEDE